MRGGHDEVCGIFCFFFLLFFGVLVVMANKKIGNVVEFVWLVLFVVCVSSQSEYDGIYFFFFFFFLNIFLLFHLFV